MNKLASVAAVVGMAAAGSHVNQEGVVVMDMQQSVHHHEYRQIIRQGSDPMGGNIWPVAIYWVEIEVGTPPSTFPVAVDTGSYTLDIPHVTCSTCIHKAPNNVYNDKNSSSSKSLACGVDCTLIGGFCKDEVCSFSNTYETCDLSDPTAPCTIKGRWFNDKVTLGGATASVDVNFGAITSQTSNFDQFKNIDGVMGIAGPAGSKNVFSSLVAAGALPKNMFGMCFVQGKTSNGTITFGGTDPRLYEREITYVPDTGAAFYSVELKTISVAGKAVPATSSGGAILDSGTNVLLLPTEMFDGVKTSFTNLCDHGAKLPGVCNTTKTIFDGTCYDYTPEQIALFPNMTLELNGVSLHMQPRNYLLRGEPSKAADVFCLGIRDTGRGGLLIIGDSTMENYYMVMDRENRKIGWAPVNRTNCGSIGHL